MNRVFIVHGRDRYPEKGWFPWLKKELEVRGFEVFIPVLPEAKNPKISGWLPKLAEMVGAADEQTYFVGHSLGCMAIAKYLESLPPELKVGGAVFVAGFLKRPDNIEGEPEVQEIANHWFETPVDFKKVKNHLAKSITIFSDNDPYVPLNNQGDFKDELGSSIVIERQKGHFSGLIDGITELPVVLESFLNIAK